MSGVTGKRSVSNPPQSARDFQKAALQRLTTAEFLLNNGYNLDAVYLAGYTIECSLKALILKMTPVSVRSAKLKSISSGSRMHNPEILKNELKQLNKLIPVRLTAKFRRFYWSTSLRYQTGRIPSAETKGFLKLAKAVYNWVEGEL
jgi:HEPN domain-containing protein